MSGMWRCSSGLGSGNGKYGGRTYARLADLLYLLTSRPHALTLPSVSRLRPNVRKAEASPSDTREAPGPATCLQAPSPHPRRAAHGTQSSGRVSETRYTVQSNLLGQRDKGTGGKVCEL